LKSSLWDIIKEQIQNEHTITVVILDKCLVQRAPSCKLSLLEEVAAKEGSPAKMDDPSMPLLLQKGEQNQSSLWLSLR
jgi:hypothetical protein